MKLSLQCYDTKQNLLSMSDYSVINESGVACDNNHKIQDLTCKALISKYTPAHRQSLFKCETVLFAEMWHVEKKIPQSALGLCLIELLCSQQVSIIGGQCQCQSKAPTAPNWSKPSLQMSLRCQLKSFSWNWDERQSRDGSLTATKLMWRPERWSECVSVWKSESVKASNKNTDKGRDKVRQRESKTHLRLQNAVFIPHMLTSLCHFHSVYLQQQWGLN